MTRKPLAVAMWKMAMTVAESRAFIRDFYALAGDLLDAVDVVVFPPFTALWPVAQVLPDARLQIGGQNIASSTDPAHTGQISAALLADAGCRWAFLGHWEVRRYLGDDDETLNRKVHLALEAGLAPMPAIGEARGVAPGMPGALSGQLERMLAGCQAEQVSRMAFTYEPEAKIGAAAPLSPEQAAAGCALARGWLRARWGDAVAEAVRIIYGGSVAPEHAASLLASPDVDGLGAARRGRDPAAFAEIVRHIARAKLADPKDL